MDRFVCVSVSEWVTYLLTYWVSEWVCHTKRVERSTYRSLPPMFTKFAAKVESQEMWLSVAFLGWKSEMFLSAKPEVKLIAPLLLWKNIFNVKYLEDGKRYDVGLKINQVGKHLWAFDWHYDLWPSITLNRPTSGSLKLQSNISKTVTDTKMGLMEVSHESTHRLSIETIAFYLGWP